MDSFEITTGDHFPMSDFELRYRWTEHTLLSPKQLSQLKPLQQSRAGDAWRLSLRLRQPFAVDGRPSKSLWTEIDELAAADGQRGADWLEHRLGDETSPVIVSWDSRYALETDAQTFVRFWETFCYPSSDDVAIFPLHLGWLVTFWHEEHLFFGHHRRQDDGLVV